MFTSGIRIELTDKIMDNLAQQGLEDPYRQGLGPSQWKSTLGKLSRIKLILTCNLLTHKTI
jgi:hypothetical protein